MEKKMKNSVIVLAGGSGSRMKSDTKKQYLLIHGKPVLYYTLKAFDTCELIDEIILVCGKGEVEYCRKEYVENYGFRKITEITEGGSERYLSVYEGIKKVSGNGYLYIHDGARPFIDHETLKRLDSSVKEYRACVAAVKVKDTIKMSNGNGYIDQTLPRDLLWSIQTPQVFETELIRSCYQKILQEDHAKLKITDDAMVVEHVTNLPVRLVEGNYENIKITTPDDLFYAKMLVNREENRDIKSE